MITFEQVTYTYPGASAPALQDVSLEILEGEFCAVVGPSNAGKSTLAYLIGGYVPHFYHGSLSGMVRVANLDTCTTPLSELVQTVGLIFQNPFNQISGTKFSVREEIAFGLENLGVPRPEMEARVEAVMDLVGISGLAGRSPLALSGGQMQRVAIAAVLAMQPQVLVLDEPTSQLDPIGSREVFSVVRALAQAHKMTVVMIEHKLEWVATFADRVLALVDGRLIASGPPAEVLVEEALSGRGIGQTRYTQAARQARAAGCWPQDRNLPVTLDEAARGFFAARIYRQE